MFGLGKPRSKVGRHLDRYGYTQEEFRKAAQINKDTASKLCRDESYVPGSVIMRKVMTFIRVDEPGARAEDYFDI